MPIKKKRAATPKALRVRTKKPSIEVVAQTGVTVETSELSIGAPISVTRWDPQNGNMLDASYAQFLKNLDYRAQINLENFGPHIFSTDADPKKLWEDYRGSFPTKEERQHHNCSACRQFIQRYGGLVVIDSTGFQRPLLWQHTDALIHPRLVVALGRLHNRVLNAKVTGVWLPDSSWASVRGHTLGIPETPPWRHMSVGLPCSDALKVPREGITSEQYMAERKEDFKNVMHAAAYYSTGTLKIAHNWLTMPATPFKAAEQYVKPLEFLMEMNRLNDSRVPNFNRAWRLLAAAPAGFCHPKSGMLGMLLTWIQENSGDYGRRLPWIEDAVLEWNIARDPLNYQRPKAPPKAGTIAQAEKIVAELGLESALKRRVALQDELPPHAWLWTSPKKRAADAAAQASGGVFGHLRSAESRPPVPLLPPVRCTWAKFEREVLPGLARIRFVPNHGAQNYIVLTNAVDPDARKLFKWDNDYAWYLYHSGTLPQQVSLKGGVPVDVPGIVNRPDQWHLDRHDCRILLLSGAKETRQPGLALFPECLRSELHGVRSVLEAHSKSLSLGFPKSESDQAIGIILGEGQMGSSVNLQVTDTAGNHRAFAIDRWD